MITSSRYPKGSTAVLAAGRGDTPAKEETAEARPKADRPAGQPHAGWERLASVIEPHLACLWLVPALLGAVAVCQGLWPGYLVAGMAWSLIGIWLAHEFAVAPVYEHLSESEPCMEQVVVDSEG